jgi:tRNA(Ile)-lysidine synthase
MLDPAAKLIELAGRKPRVAVAFSGGIDSTVLAYLLVKQRRKLGGLRLLHVDHGLQPASHEWSRRCAQQARVWHVPFVSFRAAISRTRGESLEAAAREARYRLLQNALKPGEVLVTAQHRDDQAETLLLQLFRGAGVSGLAGMPAIAAFGAGAIARPLLQVSRTEIAALATKAKLRWIEDPSNSNMRLSRNFLRRRVLPVIREHWPGVDKALARSATHMAAASRLLNERAAGDLARLADGAGLSVSGLRVLTEGRRRNALRAFIMRRGVDAPDAARLQEMAGPLLEARADAQPEVHWGDAVLRRRAGRLELEVLPQQRHGQSAESALKSWRWEQDRQFFLNDACESLSLVDDAAGSIDLERLPKTLVLRARRGGEELRPGPRARTQSLKKLMQSARLTLEQRARLPLIFAGQSPKDRLIAAGDRWIDASVAANVKSRRRARLVWKRRAAS